MDAKTGMLLWVAGGAGVFLLWSGATNRTNLGENLASYVNGKAQPQPGAPKADGSGFDNPVGGSFAEPSTGGPNRVQQDVTGTYYIYDSNGNMLEKIPDIYQSRPYSYRPRTKESN